MARLMRVARYILCVDAGYRNTGIAIWSLPARQFVHTEVIEPPKAGQSVLEKHLWVVRYLASRLQELCKRYPPVRAIAELPVGSSRSAASNRCMALATGIVTTVLYLQGITLEVVSPYAIKRWVVPHGPRQSVSKAQVIRRVVQEFGSRGLPSNAKAEHVADAMACLAVSEVWNSLPR